MSSTPRPRLLLIEDSRTFAELAQQVLAVRGFDVLVTSDAETGLRLAREEPPTAILMDIHLPGMTGYEAVAAIRADPKLAALPVIALTLTEPVDRASIQAGLRVGFSAFLTKPGTPEGFDILLEILREARLVEGRRIVRGRIES